MTSIRCSAPFFSPISLSYTPIYLVFISLSSSLITPHSTSIPVTPLLLFLPLPRLDHIGHHSVPSSLRLSRESASYHPQSAGDKSPRSQLPDSISPGEVETRERCTVGSNDMKSTRRVLGHSLLRSLVRSHRSLIRSLARSLRSSW